MTAIGIIKLAEGFNGFHYKDGDGWSIGYGTHLPLTEREATMLLEHRLNAIIEELHKRLPWLAEKPTHIQQTLYEMAYQCGVEGLLGFKNMLAALKADDTIVAAKEIMNSLLAEQTKSRAERYARQIRNFFYTGSVSDGK